jgi:hypothetical protein
MGKHTRTEAEQKALEAANAILRKMLGYTATGRQRSDYIYFESPDQRLFCYTPWKDHNGDYFTWVMKPVGRGARSGKARRWKRVGKVVTARTRKTARKRARRRYENWLEYLNQKTEE